jgi:hypothetical protein
MRRGIIPAALALAVSASPPASGQMLCTAPVEPFCINRFGTFDDDWSFRSCRRDVETYREEVRAYLSCLRLEEERIISEVNRVIERFNCRARGERFCP